tara:strand:+ start:150 stop:1241 length:1092 start_codon:yes stop_codon:yes gene_type:complete
MGIFSKMKERRQARQAELDAAEVEAAKVNSTPINTNDDNVTANSVETGPNQITSPLNKFGKKPYRSIRSIFNPKLEQIDKLIVGTFPKRDEDIRLYQNEGDLVSNVESKYPKNYVDISMYDLSTITSLDDQDINFDFILCLKDGIEGIPDLYSTKRFKDELTKQYLEGRPFEVNHVINERNIIVVDIKPLKEKVEALRKKELSINLNRNEINGQVEVRRNLFVYSNYKKGSDGTLEAVPTYDMKELIKYITWVVSKPAANYDDRLIPTPDLGDYDGYLPETDIPEDSPSNETNTTVDDSGNSTPNSTSNTKTTPPNYDPIGRPGIAANETVLYNGTYYEWDGNDEKWEIDIENNGNGNVPGIG